jgi:hypothetical protein
VSVGDKNIGPFYAFLGGFALVSAIILYGYQIRLGHVVSKNDLIILCVLVGTCLALLRPRWLDNVIKTVADKLPSWLSSYRKP